MTQQSDECIESIKAILAIAPMLPVQAKDAQAWTDAITSILINIGAATMEESPHGVLISTELFAELLKAKNRYESVRRMPPKVFADVYRLNLSTGKPFDEIIDDLALFSPRK